MSLSFIILDKIDSTTMQAVFIVGVTTVLGLLGYFAFLKFLPRLRNEEENDLTEFIFNVIGGLYGLLLAFVVVIVWENFAAAEDNTKIEVTRISNAIHFAEGFGPRYGDPLERALVTYTASVADDEWANLANPKSEEWQDKNTMDLYQDVWNKFHEIPRGGRNRDDYMLTGTELSELGAARGLRVLNASSKLPDPLWLLILIGGVISLGFTYMYYERPKKQAFQVGILSATLGFVFFLIYAMQYPYSGSISTQPDAYHDLVEQYKQYKPANLDTGDD